MRGEGEGMEQTLEEYCQQFAEVTAIQELAKEVWFARQSKACAVTVSAFGVALALNQWRRADASTRETELAGELLSAPAAGGE